ncbi:MAG TPA: hypothetical protein VNJ07_10110 [Chitinophagales bacterium]|nr:hypothetical protein [Chitinophagales bacterium]
MRIILLSLFVNTCFIANAQLNTHPEATLYLAIQQGGGANGIAVAYNPLKKIYYCAIAGNAEFPLECFTGGENIYRGAIGFDARGLWYNEKSKNLEGNSYGGDGIYAIALDKEGMPEGNPENKYPNVQPDEQSVGAYDAASDQIFYFDYTSGEVIPYKRTAGKKGKIIKLKNCPVPFENLNSAMVYTGQKNAEIGVYNFLDAEVYFFNKKGEYQTTVTLPDDAPYNEMFNFSYANGHVFLFDKDMREWIGYKVF